MRYNRKLNGIDIEYNPEGSRMGKMYSSAEVDNISIYSSKLLNGVGKLIDEHTFDRIARTEDWEIKKSEDEEKGAINADAVSKLVAYALASSVANGIQNWQSDSYVPKLPLQEEIKVLQNILDGYDPSELKRDYIGGR